MFAHLNPKERMGYAGVIVFLLCCAVYVGSQRAHRPDPMIVQEQSPARTPMVTTPEPAQDQAQVVVDVTGAVSKPGVYKLPADSRVTDAIKIAGGPKNADLDQLNLAAKLVDGTQIVVPAPGGKPLATSTYATTPLENSTYSSKPASPTRTGKLAAKTPSTVVDLNTATAEELQTIPGIGPSTAQRILDYRKEHGSFHAVDELTAVGGIGPKKLEKMRKWLRT